MLQRGNTPFHNAVSEGRLEMAAVLLRKGRLDVNAKNNVCKFTQTRKMITFVIFLRRELPLFT